jgi:hypothetical protein
MLVAKAVVQAVQQQSPPGRFLEKREDIDGGKNWYPVEYKKAVDKTSQALREKDSGSDDKVEKDRDCPALQFTQEIRKDDIPPNAMHILTKHAMDALQNDNKKEVQPIQPKGPPPKGKKRKTVNASNFVKPTWWSRGTPLMTPLSSILPNSGMAPGYAPSSNPVVSPGHAMMPPIMGNQQRQNGYADDHAIVGSNKRKKMNDGTAAKDSSTSTGAEEDDPLPLPTAPLQTRQSSLMRFLGSSSIFGGLGRTSSSPMPPPMPQQQQSSTFQSLFSFSRDNPAPTHPPPATMANGDDELLKIEEEEGEPGSVMGRMQIRQLNPDGIPMGAEASLDGDGRRLDESLDPLPIHKNTQKIACSLKDDADDVDDAVQIPIKPLSSQVSDWLAGFFPKNKASSGNNTNQASDDDRKPAALDAVAAIPPPPGDGEPLSRSASSSIFGLIESPSMILNTLKSSVSGLFGAGGVGSTPLSPIPPPPAAPMMDPPARGFFGQPSMGPLLGEASAKRRDSLLDDYEETPMETKLRDVTSM